MTMNDRLYLDALLREKLEYFTQRVFKTINPGEDYLPNWHNDCIAWHLQKCVRREIKRLIITVPPRSMKSICSSVAAPAWILGHDPSAKLICVSYAHTLAAKHARDTRTVMESSWYKKLFPGTRFHKRKNTETEMVTTRQGGRFATSVGGTVTGLGGNYILIDDPIKPDDAMSEAERTKVKEYYDGVLYSRLNNKNDDVIILIMQRLHVDDLVAHVQEKEDWTVVDIPAIAEHDSTYEFGPGEFYSRKAGEILHPERENKEALDILKRQLGSAKFEAQYQQNPVPPGGYIIKREWLQSYREPPPDSSFETIVQSWDTASTVNESSDYSVGITFGVRNGSAYVLDLVRVQLEYPDLRRRVVAEHERHRADVLLIERSSSGLSLLQDLRDEGFVRPISIRPNGDKVTRLERHTAKFEGGLVLLPEEAPWLDDFKTELLSFPQSRYDDQVDALSQFLDWFSTYRRRTNSGQGFQRPPGATREERTASESFQRPPGRSCKRSGRIWSGDLRPSGRDLMNSLKGRSRS